MKLYKYALLLIALVLSVDSLAPADPCGMVPPVQVNADDAIKRVGAQKTW